MEKYAITTTTNLRNLCIKNNWFTCGSIEQYNKLFYANEMGYSIKEIAIIIWLCSDDKCCLEDILETLTEENRLFLSYFSDNIQ